MNVAHPSSPFDQIASSYDEMWTSTAIGHAQRAAVWRVLDSLFEPGDHVLDLGCGTGADARHLMASEVRVTAIDQSAEMARIAREKGVDARQLSIEDLAAVAGPFDGAFSNFGALNCVAEMSSAARELGRLIRPGSRLAICLMGRFCLWETAWYLYRGQPRKAFRRWLGSGEASLGLTVHYPSVREIVAAFRPDFALESWSGVGLAVPPSFVTGYSARAIERLSRIDDRVRRCPLLRAAADHRLFVFVRR
jgi:ubiquinone/menaquinone biosynthesis C-methylase UbiE